MEKYLRGFLDRYDSIEALSVTDKDGIDVAAAYRSEDSDLKQSQSAIIFAAAFMQTNEHLTKLNAGRAKAVTLFYDNHIIYQESWEGLFLVIFSTPDGNVAKLYEIAAKVKENLHFLGDIVKKIQ